MNNKNEISVIIPCYNLEKYISMCLDAFIKQTFQNFEIICVDDGSTDKTAEIIDYYSRTYRNISLIRQNNQYAGVARNNGMLQATGQYILFFDGDDFCDENMLKEMFESAQKHDSDIVVCDVQTYDNQTGEYDKTVPFFRYSFVENYEDMGIVSSKDMPNQILLLASSGPWNKLYKREFIERIGIRFQASRRDNDEYFVLMSMALAEKISWVNEKLVTYRINNPVSLQGFGENEIDMGDLLSTISALRDGLKEKGRYDQLKKGLKNQILVRYIGLIEAQRNWRNFKKAFETTKEIVFPEYGIDSMSDEDVLFRAAERKHVIDNSAEEYLFWMMKRMEAGHGERYVFPFLRLEGCRNIGIYGAGAVGQAYYRQIQDNKKINLVGWYDRNAALENDDRISRPEDMNTDSLDKIIIAIEAKETADKVKDFLKGKGLSEEKIIWCI